MIDFAFATNTVSIVKPAFFIVAGISLWAGIHTAVIGLFGHRTQLYGGFSILCLLTAGYLYCTGIYYTAHSLEAAASALRWQMSFILLVHPAFFWFVARYTEQRRIEPWWSAIIVLFAGLLIVNIESPYSLRFSTLEAGNPLRLPWGETLNVFSGRLGDWYVPTRSANFAVFFWALWRSIVLFKCGQRRAAALLAGYLGICLAALLAAAVHGVLIDLELVESFYSAGFVILGLVLLMSASLGLDLRVHGISLTAIRSNWHREADRCRAMESELSQMTYRDRITGLSNRRGFQKRFAGAVSECLSAQRHGALMLLDLDHFKTVNDALGHAVGDELLRLVGQRVAIVLPEQGFSARLGGDEFAVLPPTAEGHAQAFALSHQMAHEIAAALRGPFLVGERQLYVGASTGIALFPSDGRDEGDLLRKADMALYAAKASGRNQVAFFAPSMLHEADQRLELEKSLHSALERDEFVLCYQPQVDAFDAVVGVEALLRWQHPEKGDLSPEMFIPVAEENGLIHAIGEWVLRQACERLVAWSKAGVPFIGHISVNVSSWEFMRPNYTDQVQCALRESGAEPSRLLLEVTEGTLLRDTERVIESMAILNSMGVRLSIDDFGMGYSSLSYLKRLPLTELKIDRFFVQNVEISDKDPLLESIVGVGQIMGLYVIAEGVETEAQKSLLFSLGCHALQGYLLCRPLNEAALLDWLIRRR